MKKLFLVIVVAIFVSILYMFNLKLDNKPVEINTMSIGQSFTSGYNVQRIGDEIYYLDSDFSFGSKIYVFQNHKGDNVELHIEGLKRVSFRSGMNGAYYRYLSEVDGGVIEVFLLEEEIQENESIQDEFYYEDQNGKHYVYNEDVIEVHSVVSTKNGKEQKVEHLIFTNGSRPELMYSHVYYYHYPIMITIDSIFPGEGSGRHFEMTVVNYAEKTIGRYDLTDIFSMSGARFMVSGVVENKVYFLLSYYYGHHSVQNMGNLEEEFLISYNIITKEMEMVGTTGKGEKIIGVSNDELYIYSNGEVNAYDYNGNYIDTKYRLDEYKKYSIIDFYSVGDWILIYAKKTGEDEKKFIGKFQQQLK